MAQAVSTTSNRATIVVIVVVLCLFCVAIVALAVFSYQYVVKNLDLAQSASTPAISCGTQGPTVSVPRPPISSISTDTANTLSAAVLPDSDLYDLACRLRGACGVSHTVPGPSTPFKVGDEQQFWVMNQDTIENFKVGATLRYITPHSYFWLENGVNANDDDIKALMDTFESKIYPTDREFFGSEWTPGVDNDPHLYVLYVRGIGQSTGGYFSTPDEYNPNPKIFPYSNGHEMFVFNADAESLSDEYTYGTLAHEFQHMIHWHLDLNESTWMNEGFSEVASFLNGYTVGGADDTYARNPDTPLTDWTSLSNDPDITTRHYGESFLFLTYFLDRFGDKATQALVKDQENSLTSVDDTLKTLHIMDKQTGQPITADDVVMDWMVAMYLKDGSVGDGRYTYHNYASAPQVSATETIDDTCTGMLLNRSVNQYGADYIEITGTGDRTLTFAGSTAASVLPADPHSGKYVFWSNSADQSDTTLTHDFDFSKISGPIEFSYWTWYDLEQGYDYLYLEASSDGQHWDIIKTPSCTSKDKSGNSYGCGYNAKSGGGDNAKWINEKVDLSKYAGQKVQLRFEYVTDAEVLGAGLLLDDLSISAFNYSSDFEADEGGWKAAGFARVENVLPQTFRLALIVKGSDKTTVQQIVVNPDLTATIPLSLKSGESAVLVVTGTQRFTRLPAGYSIEIR